MSRSIACSASLVSAEARFQNTRDTRRSSSPERSIAATVVAKVAGRGSVAIASISARCAASPASKAGA
jgi:hypothetical protein